MRALVLIDFQKGFSDPIWGERNNPGAEVVALQLLAHWRELDWPVFHVQHVSQSVDGVFRGELAEFMDGFGPQGEEVTIQKSVNSAFIGTELENHLRRGQIKDLTICGLTTPHCVSTTTRMAGNLGFDADLVEDACAAFTSNANMAWKDDSQPSAQMIHDMALAHLHGEFASVIHSAVILNDTEILQ